jgi:heme-binding NEAT domain protein
MKNYIESLLVERAGYERRGLKDRVKAVDAALREVGFDHKYMSEPEIETAAIEPVVERAVVKAAKKRKA